MRNFFFWRKSLEGTIDIVLAWICTNIYIFCIFSCVCLFLVKPFYNSFLSCFKENSLPLIVLWYLLNKTIPMKLLANKSLQIYHNFSHQRRNLKIKLPSSEFSFNWKLKKCYPHVRCQSCLHKLIRDASMCQK